MKKRFSFYSVLVLLGGCASVSNNEVNQKLDSPSDKEIVLVKVLEDSRCPEGVQCVWAGEVTVEVAAYENKKLVEQTQFTFNLKNEKEIKTWFDLHSPKKQQELKGVSVLPYPKEGIQIQPQDYKIVLDY
ncbi:hypothetical protein LZZ90_01975 [Flavobacterium sp. SM15]|uniref:hypothetical protein n=1 Tax=Flavobacterium sp. SM15 TaxID=2908005 RepID=UPI001EDBB23F|nr:hypothetical protein [Flavobacterium sp. SM15]MCG2610271.1 hypothetical protein [Flavobacterium sp. SM15]